MFYLVSITQLRHCLQQDEAVGGGLYDLVELLTFFRISSDSAKYSWLYYAKVAEKTAQKNCGYFGLVGLQVQPAYSIKKWMISFASSGESKSGGGGNVFLFIPPDCHLRKITQVGCGIKLTQSHNFAVKASWVKSYF